VGRHAKPRSPQDTPDDSQESANLDESQASRGKHAAGPADEK
jgi:hypothetical protein